MPSFEILVRNPLTLLFIVAQVLLLGTSFSSWRSLVGGLSLDSYSYGTKQVMLNKIGARKEYNCGQQNSNHYNRYGTDRPCRSFVLQLRFPRGNSFNGEARLGAKSCMGHSVCFSVSGTRSARKLDATRSENDFSFDDNSQTCYHDKHPISTTDYHHFNNAGASPSPPEVVDVMVKHLTEETMLGGYAAQEREGYRLKNVYDSIATLVNAKSPDDIALTESATVAWTRAFYSMIDYTNPSTNHQPLHEGDIILTSEAEYAANIVAMQRAVEERGAKLFAVPSISGTGTVNIRTFKDMLSEYEDKVAMVCMTHIPTNSGIVNPLEEIGSIIDAQNKKYQNESSSSSKNKTRQTLYLVDACQSVGHRVVDVQALHCDALSATGRKYLRGPRGTGFLYMSPNLTQRHEESHDETKDWNKSKTHGIPPAHIDHTSASVVRVPVRDTSIQATSSPQQVHVEYNYAKGARRFEFWESAPANRLGIGVAVDHALKNGLDKIESKCSQLGTILQEQLSDIPGVEIYYSLKDRRQSMIDEETKGNIDSRQPAPEQCGIVTFTIQTTTPGKVKEILDQKYKFAVAVAPATSTPLDSAQTGTTDLVRASLSYFNTVEEIEYFTKAVRDIVLGID